MANAISTTKFDYSVFTDAEATSLRDAAGKIRAVGTSVTQGLLDSGHDLARARKHFDQWGKRIGAVTNGEWREWLEKETGLSLRWADQLMRAAREAPKRLGSHAHAIQKIGFSTLEIILRDDTPDSVVKHVAEHPGISQRETSQLRKDIIAQEKAADAHEQRLPTSSEARTQARASGTPIAARDGKIYFGATEKESEDSQRRRSQTYRVRDGVELVANIGITPETWVKEAWEWQIHDFRLADLDATIVWLGGLRAALKAQRKIVDAKQES